MCDDKTIKELLPAYREQGLDQAETLRLRDHLGSCQDCRIELSVLSMLADEAVPDPGEAFWAAMPGRMYRAVQKQKSGKQNPGLARLLDWMVLPRWGWVAASVGIVVVLAWFISRPYQKNPELGQTQEYEFADTVSSSESVNIAEFDNDELGTIDTWAGKEIASIASEADQVIGNFHETDIYEELGDLNTREVERLSDTLEQIEREG